MPSYKVVCLMCSMEVELFCLYDDAKKHHCMDCGVVTQFVPSRPHLTGLPTPIHHGKTPMHEDKGFKEELKSIYKDDPLGVPGGTDDNS